MSFSASTLPFVSVSPGILSILTEHNRKWNERLGRCAWLIGTPELDDWLPWNDFSASLRIIARGILPPGHSMPYLLGESHGLEGLQGICGLADLNDFWHVMPEMFDRRVAFEPEELPALFCALAEPPRFGTAPGRYPDQISDARTWQTETGTENPRILDVGCGTGLGTLELARELHASLAIGLTPDPFEIAMARSRCLPHDPNRQKLFDQFKTIKADFRIGSAQDFALSHDDHFHCIFCNGLIGGPMMNTPAQMEAFIDNCRQHLLPGGRVFIANRFHDGRRATTEKLLFSAKSFNNNWRNAHFSFK